VTAASTHLRVAAPNERGLDVIVVGDDDVFTVVFHAGTPNGLVAFPPEVWAPRGYRVVYYARPGYAESTSCPGRSVADAAADTVLILDALGVAEFACIGWSGGGPHALACAALLPERCRATAVLAGLAPPSAGVQDWSGSKLEFAVRGDLESLTAAIEADRAAIEALDDAEVAAMYAAPSDLAVMSPAYVAWLAAYARTAYMVGPAGAREDWVAFASPWGFELTDALGVAIWQGDADVAVTVANSTWCAERSPNSRLHILPGEGHLSIGLRLPEITADLIRRAQP